MGLGGAGRHVLHPHWSQHHRPTATSTMTSTCVITRANGTAASTAADGTWTPGTRATVYTGPCRIVPNSPTGGGEKRLTIGERQTTERDYLIQIRYDTAEIRVGDILTVTDAVDAGLVGMGLRVSDVRYSSEQWERNLVAVETLKGA